MFVASQPYVAEVTALHGFGVVAVNLQKVAVVISGAQDFLRAERFWTSYQDIGNVRHGEI